MSFWEVDDSDTYWSSSRIYSPFVHPATPSPPKIPSCDVARPCYFVRHMYVQDWAWESPRQEIPTAILSCTGQTLRMPNHSQDRPNATRRRQEYFDLIKKVVFWVAARRKQSVDHTPAAKDN